MHYILHQSRYDLHKKMPKHIDWPFRDSTSGATILTHYDVKTSISWRFGKKKYAHSLSSILNIKYFFSPRKFLSFNPVLWVLHLNIYPNKIFPLGRFILSFSFSVFYLIGPLLMPHLYLIPNTYFLINYNYRPNLGYTLAFF